MKNPKLIGADVYIARLGKPPTRMRERSGSNSGSSVLYSSDDDQTSSETEDACCRSIPAPQRTNSTGSLHDELKCKGHNPSRSALLAADDAEPAFDRCQIRDSRPCYRCVSYMHSAGVRRCFWTNGEGKWDSAKVRDLYDQLSGVGFLDDATEGVFITKHEVLRLRRLARRELAEKVNTTRFPVHPHKSLVANQSAVALNFDITHGVWGGNGGYELPSDDCYRYGLHIITHNEMNMFDTYNTTAVSHEGP